MKIFLYRFFPHLNYTKAFEWGKLISVTGGTQIIVQLAGLISGIVIIRLLPTQEYALYTLANTMLATMTILSDGGVAIGLMSEGSQVWKDKKELGIILATGFELRKTFAIAGLLLSLPVLIYLLQHHGASWFTTAAITVSIVPAFLAAISDSIYEIVPKLHQNIKPLQYNQLSVSIGRLILSIILVLIFPFAYLAIIASSIPRIYGNIRLKTVASGNVVLGGHSSPAIKNRILKIVKRSMPGLIYYCLSGQLNIWLISFFGQSKSIATLGAISRLTMGINLFSSVFSTLIIPRFARLPNSKLIIKSAFLKLQLLLISICSVIMLVVWLGSKPILWIIGTKYSGFGTELFLTMLGSCAILMVGSTYSLYSTKGWIMHPVQSISVSVLSIIAGIFMFDISTLRGVLYLNIFIASMEYINHALYSVKKISRLQSTVA